MQMTPALASQKPNNLKEIQKILRKFKKSTLALIEETQIMALIFSDSLSRRNTSESYKDCPI